MKNLLILKRNPVNRDEKRYAEREHEKIIAWFKEDVVPLEIEFWEMLKAYGIWHPNIPNKSYLEVYEIYKEKFISLRDKTNHWRKKMRFFDTDLYYFENLYKPLENESTSKN